MSADADSKLQVLSGCRIRQNRVMTQPTLTTDRLVLEPLSDDHLELEVELDSDPEVMRYTAGRPHSRAEVEQSHRRRLRAAQEVPGLGF